MIEKIKIKLRKFVDLRVGAIIKSQTLLQQTNFNYNQISQLFNESSFIPFSSWAISPNAILHILNDITMNKRKAVIEFGAGASTFYIAKLIDKQELGTLFYSVESDQVWAEELARQLKILKLDHIVKIIYAPIKAVPTEISFGEQSTWYDIDILNSKIDNSVQFDVVVVDGPVGKNTPYSRFSAIPFLKDKMKTDFSVFLDDINRSDEMKITEEWQRILNCRSVFYERYVNLTSTDNFDTLPFQLENIN